VVVLTSPFLKAFALRVSGVLTLTPGGPAYCVDVSVGWLPSVV
jgi:hypothetical protein